MRGKKGVEDDIKSRSPEKPNVQSSHACRPARNIFVYNGDREGRSVRGGTVRCVVSFCFVPAKNVVCSSIAGSPAVYPPLFYVPSNVRSPTGPAPFNSSLWPITGKLRLSIRIGTGSLFTLSESCGGWWCSVKESRKWWNNVKKERYKKQTKSPSAQFVLLSQHFGKTMASRDDWPVTASLRWTNWANVWPKGMKLSHSVREQQV